MADDRWNAPKLKFVSLYSDFSDPFAVHVPLHPDEHVHLYGDGDADGTGWLRDTYTHEHGGGRSEHSHCRGEGGG